MKYYYKLENRKFNSFINDEDHKDLLFDENGNIKEGYVEILEEDYKNLINSDGVIVYENDKLISKQVPVIPTDFIKPVFNTEKWQWEENISLDEELNYYKNMIIQKTRELAVTEAAGFSDPKVEKELEELKAIHMELSHEMANEINLTY